MKTYQPPLQLDECKIWYAVIYMFVKLKSSLYAVLKQVNREVCKCNSKLNIEQAYIPIGDTGGNFYDK